MAEEEEAPAESVAVEEVQMSVLDALKEVSKRLSRFNNWTTRR